MMLLERRGGKDVKFTRTVFSFEEIWLRHVAL
jgi:hypothetical protein